MNIIKGVWTIMTNIKAIIITFTIYSMVCLYGLIITCSDSASFPMRAFFGTISFLLIMCVPILYKWIVISAKKIINNFDG